MINVIKGGVTAPKGYKAAGVACGVKANGAKDLALLSTEATATAVGVYTQNIVKGHSLDLTISNMKDGLIDAVLINSGCANACVGEQGVSDAREIVRHCAERLNCDSSNIIFGSTGVIGVPLKVDAIKSGVDKCVDGLSTKGGADAAIAIMTTDTFSKEVSVELNIDSNQIIIGGMAKGSGMIHPNMATMICVITTDANISRDVLDTIFKRVINRTFNRVSVDGDTSVCDMAVMLANGASYSEPILDNTNAIEEFEEGLLYVCETLAKSIAKDGEGATKLIDIIVKGAESTEDAHCIADSIAKSPLVKTAMFGKDANWGRIITAAGYSGANFDPQKIDIYIGDVLTCEKGVAQSFSEEDAMDVLCADEITITLDLNMGTAWDRMWTCDFSYDYVKINGSYRS